MTYADSQHTGAKQYGTQRSHKIYFLFLTHVKPAYADAEIHNTKITLRKQNIRNILYVNKISLSGGDAIGGGFIFSE
jgi:hypothetical protein